MYKYLLTFSLLTIVFGNVSFAQAPIIIPFGGTTPNLSPQGGGSHKTKWSVSNASAVTSIVRCDNTPISLDFFTRNANCVRIDFDADCELIGDNIIVSWETENLFGSTVASNSFTIIMQAPTAPIVPNVTLDQLNTTCNVATLRVTNPVQGASYVWNNAPGYIFPGSSGITANYPVVFPTPTVQTYAICGPTIGPPVPTDAMAPMNFTPGVSIQGFGGSGINEPGSDLTICQFDGSVFLTGTSNTCVTSSNWVWSATGGNLSGFNVSTGNNSSIQWTPDGSGFYEISLSVTNFQGIVSNSSFFIQVKPQIDPFCGFFLKTPKKEEEKPQAATATKLRDKSKLLSGESEKQVSLQETDLSLDATKIKGNTLFPNPAKEFITIDNLNTVQSLQIFDISGRLIRDIPVEANEVRRTVNVSTFNNGIYLLKMTDKKGQIETKKFQVIH